MFPIEKEKIITPLTAPVIDTAKAMQLSFK